MSSLAPPKGEVGQALERVLESETFARSGRARDLLRYVVAREQAGEADSLKGYAIALDVFGRDDAFDPSTDAVVRVQARRLRDLLEQYYEGEGSDDPLRIVIPLGSYVPSYVEASRPAESAPPPDSEENDLPGGLAVDPGAAAAAIDPAATSPALRAPADVQRQLRLFWVAMGAVILLLGFVTYRVGFGSGDMFASGPDDSAETVASVTGSLPTVHVSVEPDGDAVGKVAALLRGALAGFDTVDYVAKPYEESAGGKTLPVFLFHLSQPPDSADVRIELRHAPTARILVTRRVAPDSAEDAIADLLTSVAPASGAIYAFIANNGLSTSLIDCLLKNDYYYRDPSEPLFIDAYNCMNSLREQGERSPLIYSELAALELQGIVSRYPFAEDFTREHAVECARKAIQMGPTSPYAHRAYGYLLLRLGNDSEGLAWMRKAYELNTYDVSMAASYAYALVFSGDYNSAAPILERAVRVSSAHPNWWDYSLFLAQLMLGNEQEAANATLALETTKRAHYLAARMIVAHKAGDLRAAEDLRSTIVEEYPVFAADPRAYFEQARYPEDLTERLIEAMSAAGLVSAS